MSIFCANVYRCFVPDCDNPIQSEYNEAWLPNAVPGTYNGYGTFVPEQCQVFATRQSPLNDTHPDEDQLQCPAKWFAMDKQTTCTKWVFDKHERTIVNDVGVWCGIMLAFICSIYIIVDIYMECGYDE